MKCFLSYLTFSLKILWIASSVLHDDCQPEQVHIAFGEKVNDISVTWSTMNVTKESFVLFGENNADSKAVGVSTLFIDGGIKKHQQWIHRVTLKNLKYDTKYVYKAGSEYGMSKEFSFKTPPEGDNFVMNALFFGDMGIPEGKDHKTLAGLIYELEESQYHMAVHNGDFGYNLHDQDGKRGDAFMRMIEPVAANIPYMTSPGNHEVMYNFSHYKNRFTMPSDTQNMFYSFNLGLVHFIAANTEVYYANGPNKAELQTHYNWLVHDLDQANKKENRNKHPWIILFAHRPMYCTSATAWDQCRDFNGEDYNYPHRVGIQKFGGMGLEPLLKDFGVDMVIWAHEHYYERSWPVYNKAVYNGTKGAYINPGAPVHITTGAAGNDENQDKFYKDPHAWSAFGSSDYGYGRLRVYNRTHLYWDEMSTDKSYSKSSLVGGNGGRDEWKPTKIDELWLIREDHKPYNIK